MARSRSLRRPHDQSLSGSYLCAITCFTHDRPHIDRIDQSVMLLLCHYMASVFVKCSLRGKKVLNPARPAELALACVPSEDPICHFPGPLRSLLLICLHLWLYLGAVASNHLNSLRSPGSGFTGPTWILRSTNLYQNKPEIEREDSSPYESTNVCTGRQYATL